MYLNSFYKTLFHNLGIALEGEKNKSLAQNETCLVKAIDHTEYVAPVFQSQSRAPFLFNLQVLTSI